MKALNAIEYSHTMLYSQGKRRGQKMKDRVKNRTKESFTTEDIGE
jgi:hypothetical protein